jgi:hypothetical protein
MAISEPRLSGGGLKIARRMLDPLDRQRDAISVIGAEHQRPHNA